jgi:hypothetical protein
MASYNKCQLILPVDHNTLAGDHNILPVDLNILAIDHNMLPVDLHVLAGDFPLNVNNFSYNVVTTQCFYSSVMYTESCINHSVEVICKTK